MDPTLHVGVLRLALRVSGARSLKDRRQVLNSLRDRVRHRFEVTWNEVDDGSTAARAVVACTTSGKDARQIRSVLDRIVAFVESSGGAWPETVDLEIFPWHPPDAPWLSEETEND